MNNGFDEVRFLRFVPQGRGADINLFNNTDEFSEISISIRNILKMAPCSPKTKISLGHPINFLFLTGDEKLYPEEYHYCRGGKDAPLILPDGTVSMCPAWKNLTKFSAGNIYETDFENIWDSGHFQVFRKFISEGYLKIHGACGICQHLQCCRGKCVAQRLLVAQNILPDASLEELLVVSPDPQCFKYKLG